MLLLLRLLGSQLVGQGGIECMCFVGHGVDCSCAKLKLLASSWHVLIDSCTWSVKSPWSWFFSLSHLFCFLASCPFVVFLWKFGYFESTSSWSCSHSDIHGSCVYLVFARLRPRKRASKLWTMQPMRRGPRDSSR